MKHWEEGFDWKNATYFVRDIDGNETGPFVGIYPALRELWLVWHKTGHADLTEASSRFDCALIWPDGRLMLSDLHDDEGNRLSYRMNWGQR